MSRRKGITTLEIILIIVLIILVYIMTVGYVNLLDKLEEKDKKLEIDNENKIGKKEEKITLSKLKYRHGRLKEVISKNEEINNKLNRRFKLIYNIVKVILVLLFLGFVLILYFVFGITGLSQILTLIGASALFMVLLSFLSFGTLNGITDFNNKIKLKLESSIRSKCISIEEKLPVYRREERSLIAEINLEEKEISEQVVIGEGVYIKNKDEIV